MGAPNRRSFHFACVGVPEFGKLSLRDLAALTLQRYFSGLAASPLAHESKDKIRDVLSSILGSAVQYGLLVKNPVGGIRIPADKRGKRKTKPHVTPEQFEELLKLIPEPYASMGFCGRVDRPPRQRIDRPALGRCRCRLAEYR